MFPCKGLSFKKIMIYWATSVGIIVVTPTAYAATSNNNSIFGTIDATTIDFENLAGQEGQQFGFAVGQPYASFGLTMGYQIVKNPNPDMGSKSKDLAAQSATVYELGYSNYQWFSFTSGQSAIGFFYQDLLATSISISALDKSESELESITLKGGSGYIGFLRDTPDIFKIQISAPHNSVQEAYDSRTFIDDLSFTAQSPTSVPEASSALSIVVLGFLGAGLRLKQKKTKSA
jgi:hypothetical protein